MNEEFSKTLKEDMLKQFTDAKKDLEQKISTLEEVIPQGKFPEEKSTDFSNTIDQMKEVARLIDNIINAIQDKEADFNQTEFLQNTKYENSWIKNRDKSNDIDEKLTFLANTKQKLTEVSNDKLKKYIDLGEKRIDEKIALLKKKQGTIQERQRKILNKRIADILKQQISKFKNPSVLAEKMIKNNQMVEENIKQQNAIKEMREVLNSSGSILNKFTAAKLWFVEKLTIGKIKTLQGKQGILSNKEKNIVKKDAGTSLISKMKNNAKKLLNVISEKSAPYMMPSKKWQEEHLHEFQNPETKTVPESKTPEKRKQIDVIRVLDEIYKVDEMGNIVEFLGKESKLDTTDFHYVDAELTARTR